MTSALDQLKQMTTVVADTGALDAVRAYQPVDCTTNPSIVFAALKDPASGDIVAREIETCRRHAKNAAETAATLTVAIGAELAKLVPGRVSTEVDACLSFETHASVRRGREIIADYAARGVPSDRILIKLAATWEGIRAAEKLQRDGIDCNLTLLFSLTQAIACADAGVHLISPFVGRITDWHKKQDGVEGYEPDSDPGVTSVHRIYDYYKSNGISTIVMGASFRTADQIKALAGCDKLTIGPKLLDQLSQDHSFLRRALSPKQLDRASPAPMSEAAFRWAMNADAMATDKLAEGLRLFDADHRALIQLVQSRMEHAST